MNKLINIIFIVSLFASSAQALELGQAKLLSRLNEPLKADISLGKVNRNDLADLHFSLADQDTYRSIGLDKPFYLNGLKFKLIAGSDQQHFVQVTTRQRMREPILDLFIKLEGMQGSLTRLYTLMLDPRELGASNQKPLVQALPVDKQVVAAQPKVSKAKAPTKPGSNVPAESGQKTLLVANDSISIIAQNSPLHEKYSVYQIMRAFYLLNPQAFIKGNINHLQAGSRLLIPAESLVAEVPRQQAVNFVYAKSKNQPDRKQPAPAAKPRPELARTDLDRTEDEQVSQPGSTKVQPDQNKEPQPVVPSAAQNAIKKDIEDWRNMADEFSNLSFIVQTQNSVLKTHGDVLKQVNTRIEQDAGQLQQLQQRIDLLEQAVPAMAGTTTPSAFDGTRLSTSTIDNSAADTRNMIELINLRLQALEQQAQQQSAQPPADAMPVEIKEMAIPVAKIQQPEAAPEAAATAPDMIDQDKGWMAFALVALAAFLLLVVREISWRRKMMQISRLPDVLDTTGQKEQEPQVDLKTEAQQDSASADVDIELEQTRESNLQAADEKFEQAVSQAREFKLDAVAAEAHHTSQPDDDALYAEIDILIAYQLYDEALNMVQQARVKKPDNHCLDIRELEILAYTKEEDLFLEKYEAQKEPLSAEFPEAWARIEALHSEIDTTYPRIVTL